MLVVETPAAFADHVGLELGATDWVEIRQDSIDAFAEITGADHWIHVDVDRAEREMPDRRTIAHGLYLLALAPRPQRQLFRIEKRGAGLNCGYEKIRFTAPVPCGARVRLWQEVAAAVPQAGRTRIELINKFEFEGQAKPALVAHGVLMIAHL